MGAADNSRGGARSPARVRPTRLRWQESDTPMPPAVGRADIDLYVEAFRAGGARQLAPCPSALRGGPTTPSAPRSCAGGTIAAPAARPRSPISRGSWTSTRTGRTRGCSRSTPKRRWRGESPMQRSSTGIGGAIQSVHRVACAMPMRCARGEENERAAALVRTAWVEGSLHVAGAARDLSPLPFDAAIQRITSRAWTAWYGPTTRSAARRMYRYVDEGHQHLAEARLLLRARQGGVDGAIARVPRALRDHPGLVYERLRWRRAKGRDDDARALLREPPPRSRTRGPSSGGRSGHILARRVL